MIYDWADATDGQDERCIFWLSGLAGTGKSTVSLTVARRCSEQKRLGASFFFSKGGRDVSDAGKFFTSLALQLAKSIPSLQKQICDAIVEQSDIASLSLSEQWRQLILGPLQRLQKPPESYVQKQICDVIVEQSDIASLSLSEQWRQPILGPLQRLQKPHESYVLVIDALDECEGDENVRTILKLLAEAQSLKTVRLRVFLTSRPEIPIRHGIHHIPQILHQDFILHNVLPTTVNHDISLFLEYNLGIIAREWDLGADWPGEVVLRKLVLYACGLFIWASMALRFIRDGNQLARKRLDKILTSSSSAITAPEKHLNEIYLAVLKHSISSDFSDEERKEVCDTLKRTLGSLVVSLSPLSTSALSRLLQLPREEVDSIFNNLHAILDIPDDPTRQLRLHHPSFRDFLLNEDRCGDFWVDEKDAHQRLATSCIQLMSEALKKDICSMRAPGSQVSQVRSSLLQECLPPDVQYACLYWVQHLQRSGAQASNGEEAHRFLQAHLLHWLEALGWMGKISEGIQAILALEAHVSVSY